MAEKKLDRLQIMAMSHTVTYADRLVQLFHNQIHRLYEIGAPKSLIQVIDEWGCPVVAKALSRTSHAREDIALPFFPVLPIQIVGFKQMITLIQKIGPFESDHFPEEVLPPFVSRNRPHYVFGLRTNPQTRGLSSQTAVQKIRDTPSPELLTFEELLSLILFHEVPAGIGYLAMSYKFGSMHVAPLVRCSSLGEKFGLTAQSVWTVEKNIQTPSCEARL